MRWYASPLGQGVQGPGTDGNFNTDTTDATSMSQTGIMPMKNEHLKIGIYLIIVLS